MFNTRGWLALALLSAFAVPAMAQSFRVQCPTSTITHPDANGTGVNNAEPAYLGPTTFTTSTTGSYQVPSANVNGAIKCQQISGGDGYATMADGHQTFLFSFGPLSGLANIAAGNPNGAFDAGTGAVPPNVFNTVAPGTLVPGDPATTNGALDNGGTYSAGTLGGFTYNGAVGLALDADCVAANNAAITAGSPTLPCPNTPTSGPYLGLDGHVDPRQIMDVGVMNGNIPAPLITMDEDDEFFLTLTNVGMIMRPDLFEQHTVHFHGYPNASAFYDGVPDASVAINIGGSFTYYYLAPDAGTYFWHCHITPPEHLQMGMVGQLFVRPRQNRVAPNFRLFVHKAIRADVCALPDPCRLRHHGRRMNTGRIARRLIEKLDGVRESQIRIGGAQRCDRREPLGAFERDALIDEHRRGACGFQKREIAAIGEKRDLPGLCVFDAGNAADFGVGRAFQAAGKLLRNFREFHGRGSSYECESRISANKWRATLRTRRPRKVRAGPPNRLSAPQFFARRCARLRCRGTQASCQFVNR